MTNLNSAILTSALTVISGALVFVIGQIVLKFIIEPWHEYQQLKGELYFWLIHYGLIYLSDPDPKELDSPGETQRLVVSKKFIEIADRLVSLGHTLPLFWLNRLLRTVPSLKSLYQVAALLRFVSNNMWSGPETHLNSSRDNTRLKEEIIQLLKFRK